MLLRVKKHHLSTGEVIGWTGGLLILIAYAGTSFQALIPESITYTFLNIAGALGIIIHSALVKDYQPLILNAV